MKCPKCGYNSFEIHDTCKKCANDLTSYKDIHGLKFIVLPHETRAIMAEKLMAEKAQDVPAAVAEAPVDMFSFDIPEGEATTDAGSFLKDDPFNFDDVPASPAPSPGGGDFSFGKEQMSAQAKAEEDAFADLLESSSQNKGGEHSIPQPVKASTQVESELSSFSWDDTPATASGEQAKPVEDDFNSLFGDTDDTAKK
jgi:hypothetical protein